VPNKDRKNLNGQGEFAVNLLLVGESMPEDDSLPVIISSFYFSFDSSTLTGLDFSLFLNTVQDDLRSRAFS
jgi:hypothetical protein